MYDFPKSNCGLWKGHALDISGETDTVLQLEASWSSQSCRKLLK